MLQSGTKPGPYEIAAPIGAGGMGEVYKARDTWLERIVAIKILPEHLAGISEIRERFERRFEFEGIARASLLRTFTYFDEEEATPEPTLLNPRLSWQRTRERSKKTVRDVASC